MIKRIQQIYLTRDIRKTHNLKVEDDNTDVILKTKEGEMFVASFFSYNSIKRNALKNQSTHAYLQGQYFLATNVVFVEECSRELIELVVKDLEAEGNLENVFLKL